MQKNAELEKLRAQGKYMKTFETDILKLRADELSFTLCMFVKEVKKPNGDMYAPDSIFYLTLGIQVQHCLIPAYLPFLTFNPRLPACRDGSFSRI